MFSNLFASYNVTDFLPQTKQDLEQVEEFTPLSDYYQHFIPEAILQQQKVPDAIISRESEQTNLPNFEDFHIELPKDENLEEEAPQIDLAQNIVNTARKFVGGRYISGGKSPKAGGFDCSGLIHYAYKQNNIQVPSYSGDFQKVGTKVDNLYDVEPGDIICMKGHVKMVSKIEDGTIFTIEAKGKNYGIIESPLKSGKGIITIRRVLNNSKSGQNLQAGGKFNSHPEFVRTLNDYYQSSLKDKGLDPNYSYILVAQDALESGWGQKLIGDFNYGNIKTPTLSGYRDFSSIQDYCDYKVEMLSNDRYNAFSTVPFNQPEKFLQHINDAGYSSTPTNTYVPYIMDIYKTVKKLT